MKKLLLFCIGTSLLYSCKKDKEPKDNYTINGIHEISFGNQITDTMSFSVDLLPGGAQEMVDLHLEGLPEDLSATFSKASGTPSFNSLLTIKRQESSIGTHYAQLIGISPNGKRKAYAVKVVVPPLRDMRFDGKYFKVTETNNGRALKFVTIRSEQDLTLSLSLPAALPNTAGTYQYRITADNPFPGEAQLKLWAGDRFFIPGNNGATKILLNLDSTGTVTKVYLPDIEVSTEVAPVLYRILGVNYNK